MTTILIVDKPTRLNARALSRVMKGGPQFANKYPDKLRREFDMKIVNLEHEQQDDCILVRQAEVEYTTYGSDALVYCMTMTDNPRAGPRLGYRNE